MEALPSIEIKLWFINTDTILLISMEKRFFYDIPGFFFLFFFNVRKKSIISDIEMMHLN